MAANVVGQRFDFAPADKRTVDDAVTEAEAPPQV